MRDLTSNIATRVGLNAATIAANTTTQGNIIDTQGFDAAAVAVLAGTITDGVYAVTVNESDDPGMAGATVAALSAPIANFILTDDNVVRRTGVVFTKRYLRLQVISSGITTGGLLGALTILGRPAAAPVA